MTKKVIDIKFVSTKLIYVMVYRNAHIAKEEITQGNAAIVRADINEIINLPLSLNILGIIIIIISLLELLVVLVG